MEKEKLCIGNPANHEKKRIEYTLETYADYFKKADEDTTFLVVANNCSDKTVATAFKVAKKHKNIEVINLKPGGKGFAVKKGFEWALHKNFDWIGFVDADMATLPQYYYDLFMAAHDHDGAIASRYIKGAIVTPKRPWLRKIGGKFYNWMLRSLSGLKYKDTQCGAKIFTKDTIEKVTPLMHEVGWSFDLELLYLCKLFDKDIVEVPTVWSDQPGTHLKISTSLAKEFLNSPRRIKQRHKEKKEALKKARQKNKKLMRKKN